jgi:hypothetical protein
MDITHYQSEVRAWGVTQSILKSGTFTQKFDCGTVNCSLGANVAIRSSPLLGPNAVSVAFNAPSSLVTLSLIFTFLILTVPGSLALENANSSYSAPRSRSRRGSVSQSATRIMPEPSLPEFLPHPPKQVPLEEGKEHHCH